MTITVIALIIAVTVTMVTVPKIYCAFVDAKLLYLEQELELLRELQSERSECMLRYLGCGFGVMILIWMVRSAPELLAANQMAPAMAVYASGSLFFALLESLLVQKIAGWLAAGPARVKMQDQR